MNIDSDLEENQNSQKCRRILRERKSVVSSEQKNLSLEFEFNIGESDFESSGENSDGTWKPDESDLEKLTSFANSTRVSVGGSDDRRHESNTTSFSSSTHGSVGEFNDRRHESNTARGLLCQSQSNSVTLCTVNTDVRRVTDNTNKSSVSPSANSTNVQKENVKSMFLLSYLYRFISDVLSIFLSI